MTVVRVSFVKQIILTVSLLAPQFSAHTAPATEQPNIVIFNTDDWGHGDLGSYKALADVQTPNVDRLAEEGVLFTDAYVTAPQCAPSRAGLLTGRYQERYGFDSIPDGPLPPAEVTIADRLRKAGYVTGMVGKWHLEPNILCMDWARKNYPNQIQHNKVHVTEEMMAPYSPHARGFDEFYWGERLKYVRNFGLDGSSLEPDGVLVKDDRFRVDVQSEAALAFIGRHAGGPKPFFLYVAHYAPHVPLEATPKYLSRFPGKMPERRRTGLAMMSAIDDNVGQVLALLKEKGILDNTLVIFTSDNGAPLGARFGEIMEDVMPVEKFGDYWNGSRNDPLTGQKFMVAEGGIRVPMIISWPKKIIKHRVVSEPVSTLDFAPTLLAAAGVPAEQPLDGINLLPFLSGEQAALPERDLYWRFWNQAAIRAGDWKYLTNSGGREMLFNIRNDKEEKNNLIAKNPDRAAELKKRLSTWTKELTPSGMPSAPINDAEMQLYRVFFGD